MHLDYTFNYFSKLQCLAAVFAICPA